MLNENPWALKKNQWVSRWIGPVQKPSCTTSMHRLYTSNTISRVKFQNTFGYSNYIKRSLEMIGYYQCMLSKCIVGSNQMVQYITISYLSKNPTYISYICRHRHIIVTLSNLSNNPAYISYICSHRHIYNCITISKFSKIVIFSYPCLKLYLDVYPCDQDMSNFT